MKKTITLFLLIFLTVSVQADKFDQIKKRIADSDCNYFEFVTIIVSDIFDTVDSTLGTALISSNGKYAISAGDEEYLSDLNYQYTYSKSTNQVLIEKVQGSSSDEILFITKLDEFYKSYILSPDLSYRLIKKEKIEGDYPDTLFITISEDRLKQIEYNDVNEELNRIYFIKQQYDFKCNDSSFMPVYPDSVEKVKL